ncbi:hypothetical protein HYH02_002632 [Chlamydomonas schloesseri]|uniref:Uncharacterized protein n=1 Tax=Chlamydomonas schloesseri TaxID=2026947 RepID=A0A835WS95_9CHLO|nr:hypothetical protein HYH02_002632 [Chlamydomonas schloesseri]|eukprot:KAG2452388.1 hypothetical protein HYH02_002632 [Chlamydomonas schloesseri]
MARSTLAAVALLVAAAAMLVAPGADAGRLGVSRAIGGSDANVLFGRRLLDTCRTCSEMASCITATCVSATSTNVSTTAK